MSANANPAMRRYFQRLAVLMLAYALILVGGKLLMQLPVPPVEPVVIGLALLTALPICGVFWAIFRLLSEIDDEYQRMLLAKQVLLATAVTLCVSTVWQFLKIYDLLIEGPQWFGAIWLAMFGLAAPIVRWRA